MKRCCRPPRTPERGFTVIELLCVVAIIGFLSAVVALDFRMLHNTYKLRIAAMELEKNIQMIQQKAVTECAAWRIVFQSNSYQIAKDSNAKQVRLPEGIMISNNFTSNTLKFNSSASPNQGGHVVLATNENTYNSLDKLYIVVSVATGRVRISESFP